MSDTLTAFQIAASDEELEDLRRRLRATRWPEAAPVDDWSQGAPLAYVQEVCAYWADGYDWRKREALLNRFALCIDIQTVYLNGTASGFQESGQHLHDRGLACAIVPKQSDDLSRADIEGDLIDRSQTTVGSSQCFNS